ncbi:MAG: response regulator [Lachnospiraceae bacterium]|nr:response regulator [Lachnospiraceae bacterium]
MVRKRILAIDDSVVTLKQLQNILEKKYDLVTAASGVSGLKHLDNELFDLVLLDLEMPVMDGFATLTTIRQRDYLKDIPVIILTGTRNKQDVLRGITNGVIGYIVKPINSQMLLEKIELCFGEEE